MLPRSAADPHVARLQLAGNVPIDQRVDLAPCGNLQSARIYFMLVVAARQPAPQAFGRQPSALLRPTVHPTAGAYASIALKDRSPCLGGPVDQLERLHAIGMPRSARGLSPAAQNWRITPSAHSFRGWSALHAVGKRRFSMLAHGCSVSPLRSAGRRGVLD